MICPNCSTEIHFHANVPKFLSAPDWEFWGNVSSPVGEVDNRHTYGRLRGDWTVVRQQRAIRCKSADFVHFYVILPDGSKSHRLAMIGDDRPKDEPLPPINRENRKWSDLFSRESDQ